MTGSELELTIYTHGVERTVKVWKKGNLKILKFYHYLVASGMFSSAPAKVSFLHQQQNMSLSPSDQKFCLNSLWF